MRTAATTLRRNPTAAGPNRWWTACLESDWPAAILIAQAHAPSETRALVQMPMAACTRAGPDRIRSRLTRPDPRAMASICSRVTNLSRASMGSPSPVLQKKILPTQNAQARNPNARQSPLIPLT
jgi:hypothetical protein